MAKFKRIKLEDNSALGLIRAVVYINVDETESGKDVEVLVFSRMVGTSTGNFRHSKLSIPNSMVDFTIRNDERDVPVEEKLASSIVYRHTLDSYLYEHITYDDVNYNVGGGKALGMLTVKKRELGIHIDE